MWHNLKNFLDNLPFFIRQAWYWRSWDYTYSIALFADALEKQGKTLIEVDRHVCSHKYGRRALIAAAMLKKAYLDSNEDKSLAYHMKQNKMIFKKTNLGYRQICHEYYKDEKYYTAMWNAIHARVIDWKQQRKDDAWKYVHKHIESFWC